MEFEENKEKFEGKTQGIFYLGNFKTRSYRVMSKFQISPESD